MNIENIDNAQKPGDGIDEIAEAAVMRAEAIHLPFTYYAFEEGDDARTWFGLDAPRLLPDWARQPEKDLRLASMPVSAPHLIAGDQTALSDAYWEAFEQLLNACGQAAYHWHMLRNVKKPIKNQAQDIASEYHRDADYYRAQRIVWVTEAQKALAIWQMKADEAGVPFHFAAENGKRDFLNGFVNSDRRECARHTIRYAKPKGIILTPDEIEERYQKRLARRHKRSTYPKGS